MKTKLILLILFVLVLAGYWFFNKSARVKENVSVPEEMNRKFYRNGIKYFEEMLYVCYCKNYLKN